MSPGSSHRVFVTFQVSLALALFYGSVRTAWHAFSNGSAHAGAAVAWLAVAEAAGALLLLSRRTLALGGGLVLATVGIAMIAHSAQGELRPDLLVYAAGTVLVMAHSRAGEAAGAAHHDRSDGG